MHPLREPPTFQFCERITVWRSWYRNYRMTRRTTSLCGHYHTAKSIPSYLIRSLRFCSVGANCYLGKEIIPANETVRLGRCKICQCPVTPLPHWMAPERRRAVCTTLADCSWSIVNPYSLTRIIRLIIWLFVRVGKDTTKNPRREIPLRQNLQFAAASVYNASMNRCTEPDGIHAENQNFAALELIKKVCLTYWGVLIMSSGLPQAHHQSTPVCDTGLLLKRKSILRRTFEAAVYKCCLHSCGLL